MQDSQPFELITQYQPAGDQPQAIEKLVHGVNQGYHDQLLLGVTGSGKTYTMANVIEQTQRPTIVRGEAIILVPPKFRSCQGPADSAPQNGCAALPSFVNCIILNITHAESQGVPNQARRLP